VADLFDPRSGERLRELRRGKALPLQVLARMADCSVTTLVGWEKWGIVPRPACQQRIAGALGVKADSLLSEAQAEGAQV